jgi:tRNA (cmo5U34)-methyltransferase
MLDGHGAAHGVGDGLVAANSRWSFAGDVSTGFDAHVEKSVPLYHEGHALVVRLSDFFLGDKSLCYEIGCSTGKLTSALARHHEAKGCRFVGLDVEADMVKQAKQRCMPFDNVAIVEADTTSFEFEKADLIVAYYTLQFIHPKLRQQLVDKIFQALNWGGAFILFEKVRAPDARFQDIVTQLYIDYKLERGYSSGEIVGKARSLKGVLEPFSTQGNLDMLARAGFKDVMTAMKSMCFEGFFAIK